VLVHIIQCLGLLWGNVMVAGPTIYLYVAVEGHSKCSNTLLQFFLCL
jgi:hypothetical protein